VISNNFTTYAESAGITGIETHRHLGEKRYEIKDHLGNVRAVTSDIKNASNYSLSVSSWRFLADLKSMSNYFPYGSKIEAGSWSGNDYNFGYNGMLKEGIGKDMYHTLFRTLSNDRWWSPDPLEYMFPDVSPYLSMGGNPIIFTDSKGDKTTVYGSDEEKKEFVDKLNSKSDAIQFSLDENNDLQYDFKYSALLTPLTESDKKQMDAINDKKINNHIVLTNKTRGVNVKNELKTILPGSFGGSFRSNDGKIHTIQYINLELSNKLKNLFNDKIAEGDIETHEHIEAYIGGLKALKSRRKINYSKKLFDYSHNNTLKIMNTEEMLYVNPLNIDKTYYMIYYFPKLEPSNRKLLIELPVIKPPLEIDDYEDYIRVVK